MTINVGQDFKKRWLKAPEVVRQAFLDDLTRISNLLQPDTNIQNWIDFDKRSQQVAHVKIEQAYADEKARLIEEERLRKQQALEASLEKKRAQQQAFAQSLLQDEAEQFRQQTESLEQLRTVIDAEILGYSRRYHENTPVELSKTLQVKQRDDQTTLSGIETLRLRLELEAESVIEENLSILKQKLKIAATEEIELILKQSSLDS